MKPKVKLKANKGKKVTEPNIKELWDAVFDFYSATTPTAQVKVIKAVEEQSLKNNITPLAFLKRFLAQKDTPKETKKETKKETTPPVRYTAPVQEDPLPWDFKSDTMSRVDTFMLPRGYKSPIVQFTPQVKAIIDYIVANNRQEVGWLGTVKREGNLFLINNVFIPEQEVSSVETLIDHNAMTALWEEIFSAGGDPGELYYWGHSHVNMGVSPSGQDEYQVRRFLRGCPIFLRSIHNKAGAIKMDVYDMENRVVSQCVPTSVAYGLEDTECKHLDTLIKQNVKQAVKYMPPAATSPAHRGYPETKKPISTGVGADRKGYLNYSFDYAGIDDEEYGELLRDPFYSGGYN